MARTIGEALLRVRPDTKEVGPEVEKAAKKHGRVFGGSFVRASAGPFRAIGGVLSSSIGGVVAGLGAVAGIKVFAGFIADAQASAKVAALTASTIKATGGAAKVTADQVGQLATALSNKTGKDDEAIQSGQNMLLTFKGIRNEAGKNNDIFNQASTVLTDMVAAMNGGVVSEENMRKGGIQLGKALNDPIKGISALARVGVTFTDQQKKQIAAMVKAGDVAGAQKIILAELKSEFGGAAAATSSFSDKLKVSLGNLGETIGGFLLPVVNKFASLVSGTVVPGLQAMFAAFQSGDVTSDGFVGVMERIGVAARKAFDYFKTAVLPRLKEFAGFLRAEVLPRLREFGTFLLTQVVPRVVELGRNIANLLLPILKGLGSFILTYVLPALQAIGTFIVSYVIPAITTVVGWLATFVGWLIKNKDILLAIGITIGIFAAVILASLVPAFITWAASAAAAAAATFLAIAPIVLVVAAIAALVYGIIQLVKHWDTIWAHIKAVAQSIGAWFAGPFVGFFTRTWGAIKSGVVSAYTAVRNAFERARAAVADKLTAVITIVKGLPGRIVSALGNLGSLLYGVGRDLIQGMINGIGDMIGRLVDKVKSAVSSIPGAAKKILGIGSPSKVFAGFGRDTIRGYVQGLQSQVGQLDRAMATVMPGVSGGEPSAAGPAETYVTVLLDGQAIEPRMAKVVSEHNRGTRRRVQAGVSR